MEASKTAEIETPAKGERTRAAILAEASRLATVEGIEGLTIGALAEAMSMSKSGLYAHFGSKEELQLATVGAARDIFIADVVLPALKAPRGARRLLAACEAHLSHIERRVFPGGCFFSAASPAGSGPGAVREAIARGQREWLEILERLAREAVELGELPGADPHRLAFELQALGVNANTSLVLRNDPSGIALARAAIRERLGAD